MIYLLLWNSIHKLLTTGQNNSESKVFHFLASGHGKCVTESHISWYADFLDQWFFLEIKGFACYFCQCSGNSQGQWDEIGKKLMKWNPFPGGGKGCWKRTHHQILIMDVSIPWIVVYPKHLQFSFLVILCFCEIGLSFNDMTKIKGQFIDRLIQKAHLEEYQCKLIANWMHIYVDFNGLNGLVV